MHTSRRRFLAAAAAGLALPGTSARAASPRRLAVVFAEGGWDVTYCLDPKLGTSGVDGPEVDEDPEIPEDREAIRTFGSIPVVVNDHKRPAVSRYFERWADRTAVVNGVWMGAIAHATARVRVLTGTQSQANPSIAAIAGHVYGAELPLGSIDLSGGSYAGHLAASTGQIGYQSQIKALMIDGAAFPDPTGAISRGFQPDDRDRQQLEERLARRGAEAEARWADGGRNDAMFAARSEALGRAARFRSEGRQTVAQLDLGLAATLTEQVDLAIELLRGDLCRAVTLDSRRTWDTHNANSLQHGNFQSLFVGLERLMQGLDAAGLLDDTLVVVLSEFTRTPTLNSSLGKDHWPHASALLAGGNVRGGRAYGGTDARVESLPIDLSTGEIDPRGALNKYDNLSAGILAALDVDPGDWFPTIPPFLAPFG